MDTALPVLAIVLIGLLGFVVVLLIPALYLHVAARAAKVRKPYGTAILVTFLQLILQGIFSLIVGVVSAFLTPLVGLLLGIPVLILSIFIDVWIIQGFYATRFGKAFLIWLLTIAEVLATALIVVAVAAVAGVIGGSGRTLNLPSLQYQLQQTPAVSQYYLWRLTRWSSIVNIGVLALATGLWFKTFKSGKTGPSGRYSPPAGRWLGPVTRCRGRSASSWPTRPLSITSSTSPGTR
jgi:hypothetical protein